MRPGELFAGRFELGELAGSGGMGSVYRAFDRQTQCRVAVKLMRHAGGHHQRFLREARLLEELDHPGIVGYVAHGTTFEGEPWLAMQWLEGESLQDRIAGAGLTIEESVEVARLAADALAAAHARGIVHRDLKPGNLFLLDGRTDRIRLLDFGVALVTTAATRMTRTGVPIGTLRYMSPEQARVDSDIDARADVFALGSVLFECLTGRPAFVADHALGVLAKIVVEDPPRASELRADIPPALDALVARMLAKQRESRPENGAAVARALGEISLSRAPGSQPEKPRGPSLGQGERHLISVILVEAAAVEPGVAQSHAARLELLADGSSLLVMAGLSAATDQTARAARLALTVRALKPDAALALTTGFGVESGQLPTGELVERAARLLATGFDPRGVRIDELTESLLPPRFVTIAGESSQLLSGERLDLDPARSLLGKPAPCVGRERELVSLRATVDQCLAEPVARAMLISGPPGIGKSRLRHELLATLEHDELGVCVWLGQADPVRAGAPFGLLTDLLRRSAVSSSLLAELGALGSAAHDRRRDPVLARDQLKRSWLDLLASECARQPLLMVLEDLQWGDLPSIELVHAALRALPDAPLMVLATARPEVHETFPNLWSDCELQEIRVRELTRRAAGALVRRLLAPIDDADVDRIVERAAGNALFLEELMRAHAAGQRDAPGSVLAMVQARLEAMEPEARRVLRAASVFGQVFWHGGVATLLGNTRALTLDAWLDRLSEREVIVPRLGSELPGELEYRFRHALVGDAAYAMLTEDDRALGHRLAGDWLERCGATEARRVLEHFDKGGAHDRALPWWIRAAEAALDASDFSTAIELARRGGRHAGDDDSKGALRLVEAEALRWLGQLEASDQRATLALQLLEAGSPRWARAAAEHALIQQRLGRTRELAELGSALLGLTAPPAEGVSEPVAYAMVRTAVGLRLTGERELSEQLLGVLDRGRDRASPRVLAYLHLCRALDALYAGDLFSYLEQEQAARGCFEAAGDTRRALNESTSIGFALMELGAYERAERTLSEALASARELGLDHVVAASLHNLGLVYAQLRRFEQAVSAETHALETFVAQNDRRLEGAALAYLARIHELAGQLDAAASAATRAIELLSDVARPIVPLALATLAAVRRKQGRREEAFEAASRAMRALESIGAVETGESLVRLEHAHALATAGAAERARAALAAARARVIERARTIADPELRRCFLEAVPENAETLAMARVAGSEGSMH
jgi:eukaryotic-like serine/threonine-protein kinase